MLVHVKAWLLVCRKVAEKGGNGEIEKVEKEAEQLVDVLAELIFGELDESKVAS